MRNLRPLLLPAAGLMLALVIACGGDKKSSGDSASRGSGSSDYGYGSAQSSGSGAGSNQAFNLSASASKLADLKSFRFDMTMKMDLAGAAGSSSTDDALGSAFASILLGAFGDIKVEGAFVKPDQMDMRMKMSGQEIGVVQIGKKSWVKFGGKWQESDDSDSSSFGFGNSPAGLFNDFLPSEALKGAKMSQETVNGVKTTRYSFDKKALEQMTKDMGQDFKEVTQARLDVWVNADSVPVKMLMDFAAKDESGQKMGMKLEMNIRDINSDSIKIKAPI